MCLVIDPAVAGRDRVLEPGAGSPLLALPEHYRAAGRLVAPFRGPGRSVGRADLRRALHRRPSRLLYFGHVTASPSGAPEHDAIHLTDDSMTAAGYAPPVGRHRPFSALDLMSGRQGYDDPFPAWPMPPRVAVLGCGNGRELAHREPFGLISALLRCGAVLVTATRWPLPTDRRIRTRTGTQGFPTSRQTLAVDTAHESSDPAGSLTAWKRKQLQQWKSGTDDTAVSPVLWGAVADFEHPPGGW